MKMLFDFVVYLLCVVIGMFVVGRFQPELAGELAKYPAWVPVLVLALIFLCRKLVSNSDKEFEWALDEIQKLRGESGALSEKLVQAHELPPGYAWIKCMVAVKWLTPQGRQILLEFLKGDPSIPLNARLLALSAEVEHWKGRVSEFHDQVIRDDEADAARKEPDENGMVPVTFRVFPEVADDESSMYFFQEYVDGANMAAKNKRDLPDTVEHPTPSPVKEQPPMPDDGIG